MTTRPVYQGLSTLSHLEWDEIKAGNNRYVFPISNEFQLCCQLNKGIASEGTVQNYKYENVVSKQSWTKLK